MLKSYNTEPIHNLPIEYRPRSTSKQHQTKQPAIFNLNYILRLYILCLCNKSTVQQSQKLLTAITDNQIIYGQ